MEEVLGKVWGKVAGHTELPCPFLIRSGMPLPGTFCGHQLGSSTELWHPYFQLRFCYIRMINYIIGCETELNCQYF